jgi:flagellin
MSSINTNAAAMAAVRSLTQVSQDLGKTQQRIETGLRISKANDDPAVFSISQSMRSDLNGMAAVKDSLAFGKAALTVARDAATKISDELGKLQQTITQAQQPGLSKTQMDAQIKSALDNIDAYAQTANFNGVNLLTGAGALTAVRDITGSTTTVNAVDLQSGGLGLTGLKWNSGGFKLSFDNTLEIKDEEGVTVKVGTTDYIFEFNDAAGTAGLKAEAAADKVVRQVDIDTGNDSNQAILGKLITAMQAVGINANFNNQGEIVIGNATDVQLGTDGTSASAGMTAGTVTGATGAIKQVTDAIATVGTALATLGSSYRQIEGLQDFTRQLTDSVKEGLGALVDADLAEESARLSSLQTRQQLATQSLSIANQQSQSLLSLFR